VAGTAASLRIEPLGVVAPASIASYFTVSSNDLTDAWMSVRADVPVLSYGSVVDNGTTDPTFVPAYEDTGEAPTSPPGGSRSVFVGPDFQFVPESLTINLGETVTWIFRAVHTATSDTTSAEAWDSGPKTEGETFSYVFNNPGVFHYHCSLHSVSGGHQMNGSITVQDDDPYPYKDSRPQPD
jgi:plastocyanin